MINNLLHLFEIYKYDYKNCFFILFNILAVFIFIYYVNRMKICNSLMILKNCIYIFLYSCRSNIYKIYGNNLTLSNYLQQIVCISIPQNVNVKQSIKRLELEIENYEMGNELNMLKNELASMKRYFTDDIQDDLDRFLESRTSCDRKLIDFLKNWINEIKNEHDLIDNLPKEINKYIRY